MVIISIDSINILIEIAHWPLLVPENILIIDVLRQREDTRERERERERENAPDRERERECARAVSSD
jgi:hypothetical protein